MARKTIASLQKELNATAEAVSEISASHQEMMRRFTLMRQMIIEAIGAIGGMTEEAERNFKEAIEAPGRTSDEKLRNIFRKMLAETLEEMNELRVDLKRAKEEAAQWYAKFGEETNARVAAEARARNSEKLAEEYAGKCAKLRTQIELLDEKKVRARILILERVVDCVYSETDSVRASEPYTISDCINARSLVSESVSNAKLLKERNEALSGLLQEALRVIRVQIEANVLEPEDFDSGES